MTNGILKALNALLFVVLAASIGAQASTRLEHGSRPDTGAPDAPRLLAARIDVDDPILLDFGRAMVPASRVGEEAPDGLVRLEPDVPVVATWRSTRTLRITPRRDLPRAWRVHVHLPADIRAADGSAISAPALFVETPGPRVLSAVADDVEGGTARSIVVTFNMAIAESEIAEHAHVIWIDEMGDAQDEAAVVTTLERAQDGEHTARLRLPDRDLPRRVEVRIDGEILPRDGGVPMGPAWTQRIELSSELLVTETEVRSDRIRLGLSHRAPLPEDGYLEIDPPISFQLLRRWSGHWLVGEFRPGAAYRITLRKGYPGTGSVTLAEDVVRSVRLADAPPQMELAESGNILSSRARRELAIRSINVSRLEISARPVYANNVVRLAQRPRVTDLTCGPWTSREVLVGAPRNEESRDRVRLAELLGTTERGFHEIRLRDLSGEAGTMRRLIQVTDLGVTVRAAHDNVLVRVTSIASEDPVAGAEITVLTPTNQVLTRGVSGDDGVAVLEFTRSGSDREPFLVDVRTAEDRTFVDLDGYGVELAGEAHGGRPYATGVECHVATDRGIVRPGGTVRAAVTARSPRGVSPVGVELEARWTAPGDLVVASTRHVVPDSGLFPIELDVPPTAPTGAWRVEIHRVKADERVGRAGFRVDAFVPDRLETEVRAVSPLFLGRTARLDVEARWLEGGGAGERPVRVLARLDRAPPLSGDLEGFSLERIREDEDTVPPGALPVLKATLGKDGRGSLRLRLPEAKDAEAQRLQATMRIEVIDPSGRPVSAGVSEPVSRDGPLLAARASAESVEIRLLDHELRDVEEHGVAEITFERRRWTWQRDRRRRGRYRWHCVVESVPIRSVEARVSAGRATVDVPFLAENEDFGPSWIVASVRMRIGDDDVVVDASLESAPARPDRLRVTTLEAPQAPGTTVPVRIVSPVPGNVLVSIEGRSILGHATAQIPRGESIVHVKLPQGLEAPNVHLVATLVSGQAHENAAPPYWIVGGASLTLDHTEREATVTIGAPESVEPEEEVVLTIDAPGASHATVALVDEGILRLTQHRDPDPLAHFLARRRLETRGADSGTRLFNEPVYDPGTLTGGDGAAPALAQRLAAATNAVVETVALWNGDVALDDTGRGEARFRLPPYEGRLRAMVVAAGPERVGAGSAEITVRGRLGLRVAAPRRLAPGDTTTATVTVRNNSGADGVVVLDVRPDEELSLREPESTHAIELADGATVSLDVPLRATRVGRPHLRVRASLDALVREVDATIPITPAGLFENLRRAVVLSGSGTLDVPGEWAERRARVRIGAGPGAELLPALDALVEYPHGCIEQTTSRALAVLAARSLLAELDPELAARCDDMVRAGIGRVRAMQTPSGGMTMWPGGRTPVAFGSVQALDFLVEAREQGVTVDEGMLRRLQRYIERRLTESRSETFRALAIEALSRTDAPVGPWIDALADVQGASARTRVALAAARSGDVERASALLTGMDGADRAAAGDDWRYLSSGTRLRAAILRTLLVADRRDPRVPRLATALQADLVQPELLTTQSQMRAVRGLSAWYAANAQRARAARGVLRVDGREMPLGAPLDVEVPEIATIEYEVDGDVTAFLEVSGVRLDRDGTAAAPGGLEVAREIVDLETGETVTALRRGGAYDVRLHVRIPRKTANVLVTDLLPGGAEARRPGDVDGEHGDVANARRASHIDIRDDRVMLHIDEPLEGNVVLRYRLDAAYPGTYAVPAPIVEALYEPGSATHGADGGHVEIAE